MKRDLEAESPLLAVEPVKLGGERSRLSSTLMFLICLIPAVAAVLFGGVDSITWAIFSLFWALLIVLWLGDAWRGGGLLINTSPLLFPITGLLLIGALQMVPLPVIGSIDSSATLFFTLRLLFYLTFFATCLTFINSESRLTKAVIFVIVFGAAMAFFGILQRLANPDGIYGLRVTPQALSFGPFVNQHHFAAFMEMTGGLTLGLLFGVPLQRDRRILLATAFIVMGAAVGFTGSRGGLLAFTSVVGFVVLVRLLSRETENDGASSANGSLTSRLAFAAAGLGLIFLILSLVLFLGGNDPLLRSTGVNLMDADVSTGRFHFWPIALKIFVAHPLLGSGYDSFGTAFTAYDTWPGLYRVEQAHNDYLQALADAGIAGFLCVLAFIFLLFRKGLAVVTTSSGFRKYVAVGALAGCFGILVHSFFDFPLRTPSNALFFLLLTTIAVVVVPSEEKPKRRRRTPSAHSQ
ncbi:MAG TPA: O-antigen ligase family protein [Pyrinomonadaceae bacterium]|nr:O-antigen ligase family protein [Pyrinomonadaceae bacterium]